MFADIRRLMRLSRVGFESRILCDGCLDQLERKCWKDEEEAQATARRQRREINWLGMCPEIFRSSDLAKLPVDARANWDRITGWNHGAKGLILTGPTGSGKTRAAMALLRELYVEQNLSVQIFRCSDFANECIEIVMDAKASVRRWLNAICEKDVIFFDDFGKQKFTERVEAELFSVIDRRTSEGMPIIISTNDTGETIAERMSQDRAEPMVRRLREFCEVITLKPGRQ